MSEEITRKEFLIAEKVDLEKQLEQIVAAKVIYLESAATATTRVEKSLKFVEELIARE